MRLSRLSKGVLAALTVLVLAIVYIPLFIFGGEKHKLISIDEKGVVTSTDRLPARDPRRSHDGA